MAGNAALFGTDSLLSGLFSRQGSSTFFKPQSGSYSLHCGGSDNAQSGWASSFRSSVSLPDRQQRIFTRKLSISVSEQSYERSVLSTNTLHDRSLMVPGYESVPASARQGISANLFPPESTSVTPSQVPRDPLPTAAHFVLDNGHGCCSVASDVDLSAGGLPGAQSESGCADSEHDSHGCASPEADFPGRGTSGFGRSEYGASGYGSNNGCGFGSGSDADASSADEGMPIFSSCPSSHSNSRPLSYTRKRPVSARSSVRYTGTNAGSSIASLERSYITDAAVGRVECNSKGCRPILFDQPSDEELEDNGWLRQESVGEVMERRRRHAHGFLYRNTGVSTEATTCQLSVPRPASPLPAPLPTQLPCPTPNTAPTSPPSSSSSSPHSLSSEFSLFLDEVWTKTDVAAQWFEEAIHQSPLDSRLLASYARFAWKELHNMTMAEGLFKRAVEQSPSDPEALASYALFLWEQEAAAW
eukprot:TRINITY_DN29406_c0_g1_i1.p1 TRINITY_DN29406_c0_g1~~TRINITY_DN29406_c0_g1_i1.p1  ORF type:complete len:472 (+),score=35.87 TRINITY_DN29406_c0_g1_i1:242-1657(+)